MSALDPDRFTLRQADAAREAYAQVMEEFDLARLSMRKVSGVNPLRIAALWRVHVRRAQMSSAPFYLPVHICYSASTAKQLHSPPLFAS
jgi:hypothetical protein